VRLEVAIPPELSMELHIQKVLVVRGLAFTYLRCRIPGADRRE
jgi:hypothetical protein